MKQKIAKFMLWLYLNHIKEDWDECNKLGRVALYPAWWIRSLFIWIFFPFFIPEYMFTQSAVYAHYQEFGKAMTREEQMEKIKGVKNQRLADQQIFHRRKRKKK